MSECAGKYFILNGELKPAGQFDDSLVFQGESVYEVIRLISGIPVFFSEHCDRLENSVKLQTKEMLADRNKLNKDILKLTEAEKANSINLKIVFNYNNSCNYTIYLIHSVYPSEKQFIKGVKGTFFEAERPDPESKLLDKELRAGINNRLLMKNAYEALLVNRNGFITEGSRSNIFLLKDDILYTAPDKFVLNGITRKHVLEICRENGISVNYTLIPADQLTNYESVLITGTSPGVLPFCCIDDNNFNPVHKLIPILRNLYMKRVEESIRRFRMG